MDLSQYTHTIYSLGFIDSTVEPNIFYPPDGSDPIPVTDPRCSNYELFQDY